MPDKVRNGNEAKDSEEEDGESMIASEQFGMVDFSKMFDGSTEHAADAMDFSDEDELAEEVEEDKGKGDEEAESRDVGGDESDDESDDLLKELEQEGMQGVDEVEASEIIPGGGLFGNQIAPDSSKPDVRVEQEKLPKQGSPVDDADVEKKKIEKLKEKERREKLLRVFYPSFHRGEPIKMTELFPVVPLDFPYQQPPPVGPIPLIPTKIQFDVRPDSRKDFRSSGKKTVQVKSSSQRGVMSLPERRVISLEGKTIEQLRDEVDESGKKRKDQKAKRSRDHEIRSTELSDYNKDLVLSTADWDDDEILEGTIDGAGLNGVRVSENGARVRLVDTSMDDWDEGQQGQNILEGHLYPEDINLRLDLNDPGLLFEDEEAKLQRRKKRRLAAASTGEKIIHAVIPGNSKVLESRYNVSNDRAYDILKKNYHAKVRSTIGNLTIEHAPPAIRLQSPYYSVKPTPKTLRMFHRPRFVVRSNTTMLFSRPKPRRRKKDRGKSVEDLFSETGSLTLGDTGHFFFLEYSEEQPAVLNKFGMGSKIINYYRKMTDGDTSRPKLPVGETHVLGIEDRSPFWNFGFVEKGSIVPTFYNQMVRAPIFRHDSAITDFLLVRSSGRGSSQRYFLKSIDNLYTVGQTFPAVEVPGPHSRKVSAISKNRLKMIVYRILNSDEHQRLLVKDISTHFPEHTDMQNRQRLKEFMEYQRSGEDQGFWKLKSHQQVPGYETTREMISPEDICLLESMKCARQHFGDIEKLRRERLEEVDDSGAATNSNANDTNRDSSPAPTSHREELQEMELAPWNTTRNFIQATQGKAMLQIHGKGDPSSNGSAFSFLKISMKGGFLKNVESEVGTPVSQKETKRQGKVHGGANDKGGNAHSYNVAEQQKLYDEEIAKVWYRQQEVLGSENENHGKPRKVSDEEMKDSHYMRTANQRVNKEVDEMPRYLKITRMVRNSYGILERQVDIIKDPKVVELYVKKRQAKLLEDPTELDSNSLVLTNDAEENLKVKKRLEEALAKLQKQQEKKKKKTSGITPANIDSHGRISGRGIGKGKSTSRRCATCGMLGHIRTNKCCPLYYTIHNKSNPNYIPGSEKSAHLLKMTEQSKK